MSQKHSSKLPATPIESSGDLWPTISWLLGTFWAPVTVPWLIYHMLTTIRQKMKKTTLPGKVVLITGASSGLGEALAHVFYNAGCRVILAARRKDELERVKQSLLTTRQNVPTYVPVILPLDLTDINSLEAHVQTALAICTRIDILINNGGVSCRGSVLETDIEVYRKILEVNFFGTVALTKAVLPSMLENKSGHIVFVSSVQGRIAIPHRSAYSASKHALQAFGDSLRAECGGNIYITMCSPGYIKTQLSLNACTGSGNSYGKMDKSTANGYSPEYVAEQVLHSVADPKNEVFPAPLYVRAVIYLRTLFPSLYFFIMEKRANKENE